MNRIKQSFIAPLILTLTVFSSCVAIPVTREVSRPSGNPISEDYYTGAMEALGDRDIHRTLLLLMNALEKDPENTKFKAEIDNIISSLLSESHYRMETITKGEGLSNPLYFLLYYKSEDELYPVYDMPIQFHFTGGTGLLTSDAITNDAGIAKCYVERIEAYDQTVSIEARIVLDLNGRSIQLDSLNQNYTLSSISILDQPQRVYIYFESTDVSETNTQFSFLSGFITELFRQNGFSDIECIYMKEKILFNRALAIDLPSINVLAGSENLVLTRVETSFISQQSVDFFFSSALITIQIIDPGSLAIQFLDEVQKKGAGSTRERSAYQAVVNAMNELGENVDLYLKEKRKAHGV
jgi:hypothetical protein